MCTVWLYKKDNESVTISEVPIGYNFNRDPSFESQLDISGKYGILVEFETISICVNVKYVNAHML